MPTFQELQDRLKVLKFRKTVVQHLVEHIDENFRPVAGGDPKHKLMTEDQIPVPHEIFEAVVSDTLLEIDKKLEEEIDQILKTTIGEQKAEQKAEKKAKKNSKSQGEQPQGDKT